MKTCSPALAMLIAGLIGIVGPGQSDAAKTPQPSAAEVQSWLKVHRAQIFTPFGDAVTGSDKPRLTIVEFYDDNCGYCRSSLPILRAALARHPDVRIVYRELPILGADSRLAARASLLAATQGKFLAYREALYAGGRATPERIAAALVTAGVDQSRLAAVAPRIDAEIEANLAAGRHLGFSGTPSWVIGTAVWSDAPTAKQLERAIAAALRAH